MSSRKQPEWHVPQGTYRTGLVVSNSMTSRKDEFVPAEGKQVKWYICGPTVYDSSHLGHARTYLSFDIIRRILEDYFGYDVQVCMNITDIDDKIIIRARKNYLFDRYAKKVAALAKISDEEKKVFSDAMLEYIDALVAKHAKIDAEIKSGKRNVKEATPELNLAAEKLEKARVLSASLAASLAALTDGASAKSLLEALNDPLCDYLDVREGKLVEAETLNRISKEHAAYYEAEYLADMKALGIKTPDTLTRVTEYVPEVIEMCQRIIANGFAYEANGSIYFDVAAFDAAKDHHYAKLVPGAYGNQELLAEGEGSLSTGEASEKRSPNDFALWKASKAGEPVWNSPWGLGRPGWHIECSAMAGNVLGKNLDIHAGGCDLRFPHHDNELAQSEAYFNSPQWVNYFLHTGHLHIDNLKMSKSLKNFITIREMLALHPARQVRMLFLLQSWDNNMNFQRIDTMKEVNAKEKHFREFFLRVEQVIGERTMAKGMANEHWNPKDTELGAAVTAAQAGVHKALLDNFDTATTMKCLSELVTQSNSYMEKNTEKKAFLLKKAAVFVTRILRVFGIVEGNQEFGFDVVESSASSSSSAVNARDVARPYVAALVDFRKLVRDLAKKSGEAGAALLRATDDLRDEIMPKLDVKISDDGEFGFVFQDRAELEKERAERLAGEEAARRAKLTSLLARKEKDLAKWKESAESASDLIARRYFVRLENADSAIPEKDTTGKDVSKSAGKNIKKDWTKQETANKKYLDELAAKPTFLTDLEAEVQSLKAQLGL